MGRCESDCKDCLLDVCRNGCLWIRCNVDGDSGMMLSEDEWLSLMDEVVGDLMMCENCGDRLMLLCEMDKYADEVRSADVCKVR